MVLFLSWRGAGKLFVHIDKHLAQERLSKSGLHLLFVFVCFTRSNRFRPAKLDDHKRDILTGKLIHVQGGRDCLSTSTGKKLSDVQLGGEWFKTVDIEKLSFCTKKGQEEALEHEIA
uniref:Uncharacterized protein n=1 Tax=Corethron hystrix TaxID=216773 RepID=A0A7S1FWM5_9STRA|mmetsp:Transcript_37967/g.88346  ORF Transcript_37967/g.88346 Transcript_37967/m.88346 type:complete len:117 (+) Transcript_37967:984-1334(+)